MKTAVFIFCVITIATSAPNVRKLSFRNLFKSPLLKIENVGSNGRIIGGQEAPPHTIPYQAFLEIYGQEEVWYCGGSLISENIVLTAGHCGVDAIKALVTLGAHKTFEAEDTQLTLVSKKIKVHENYDYVEVANDIAVIELSEKITFTDIIKPVSLPCKSDVSNTFKGLIARISGWGLTDGFSDTLSNVLNYVDVEVIDNKKCEDIFGSLLDSVLCTSGDQKTGSCSGDSGGPLVFNNIQIGIVSFGVVNCMPGYPSAFSRVTSFLNWIENNTDVKVEQNCQ